MPSLSNIMAGSGYRDRRDQIEAQEAAKQAQKINQAGALQRIYQTQETMRNTATDRATAAQDRQMLESVMAQTGGDPLRAIEALIKAGTPKSIELASKLKGLMPNPDAAENRASREAMAADAIASRESIAAEARAQRESDAAAQRAQRMDELRLRLSEQRLVAADRAALQRELSMMRAEQQRANSPQAIKEREKQAGKESLDSLLGELELDYQAYQNLGADIDPSRGSVANIANRIGASGVGQLVGGAVGTKEQEIRDSINQKRASLMAALKKATGMGATQLNSNVELQFYLRMATDPTMARSANQKAIQWLRETYGIQGGAAAAPTPAPESGAQGWSIRSLP